MSRYFKIGKLAGSFGFKGHLILKHSLGKKTALKGLQHIFLEEMKDSFIPCFIESASARSEDEVTILLEGISSKEATSSLMQKEVWLTEEDFKKFSAKNAPISFLGYSIIEEGKMIGEVIEVIEMPHQVLCKVMYKGNEALIPIHEESLEKVDKKNKLIHVNLPEGLLDMYS